MEQNGRSLRTLIMGSRWVPRVAFVAITFLVMTVTGVLANGSDGPLNIFNAHIPNDFVFTGCGVGYDQNGTPGVTGYGVCTATPVPTATSMPTTVVIPPPSAPYNTVPPGAASTQAAATSTNTASPATSTPVPPTATATMTPTNTAVPPTATAVPATNTAVPTTAATPAPATSTSVPVTPVATATVGASGATIATSVTSTGSNGSTVTTSLNVVIPAGALPTSVTVDVGVAAPASIPTSGTSAPAGPAIDITAKDAAGNVIHTLSAPITITIGYDPSITDTSKLVISFFDTTTNSWVALPTIVDTTAHTLTAVVTHLTLFQAQTLAANATVAPQVKFARPVSKITGRTAQGTVVGGRTTACPSVPTLLGDIAVNIATPGKDKFDPPAYPAGCVWVPVQVVSPDLASQYSGATTVVTETFPDSSSVVITNTMDARGHSISVFPVPYTPPAGAKHGDKSTIATLDGVVIPQTGAVPPPLHERFVVIAP